MISKAFRKAGASIRKEYIRAIMSPRKLNLAVPLRPFTREEFNALVDRIAADGEAET